MYFPSVLAQSEMQTTLKYAHWIYFWRTTNKLASQHKYKGMSSWCNG